MPNHIRNRIQFVATPAQISEIYEKYNTLHPAEVKKAYDGSVICSLKNSTLSSDIGWLNLSTGVFTQRDKKPRIGLPDGYEIEVDQPWNRFPDFNKIKPQPDNIFRGNLGREEEEMCREQGIPNWYQWNNQNWGTKWNSYSHKVVKFGTYEFETAWSCVLDLMIEMSKQNPDVPFLYEWADEDFGYNCGSVFISNGELTSINIPDGGTEEAYKIARRVRTDYIFDD